MLSFESGVFTQSVEATVMHAYITGAPCNENDCYLYQFGSSSSVDRAMRQQQVCLMASEGMAKNWKSCHVNWAYFLIST